MKHGTVTAHKYVSLAIGAANPLDMFVEAWMAHAGYDAKRQARGRLALRRLGDWCSANSVAPVLDAITPKVARRFADAVFPVKATAPATYNAYMSLLRGYWSWLLDREDVTANPWLTMKRGKDKAHRSEHPIDRRAFTTNEAAKLLCGPASQSLSGKFLNLCIIF